MAYGHYSMAPCFDTSFDTKDTTKTKPVSHSDAKRGVLPLPFIVGALIALVLAVAAAFILLSPITPPKPTIFRIYLSSAEEPVAGASIVAYDGDVVAGSATTNAQGIAAFEGLPAKTLTFKVSKTGYRPLVQSLDASRPSAKLELVPLTAPVKEYSITFKTKDKTTGAPLEGVAISLVIGSEKKTLNTDENGFASLKVSFLSQVSAKFTKRGYKQQAFTLLAREEKQERIVELESELRTPRLGFESLETVGNETRIVPLYGTALVTVTNKQSIPLQGAQVKVFDAATQALVASQETDESGLAIFDNLPLGKQVFFTAFKEGYLPFDGSGLERKTEEVTELKLQLEEATSLNSEVVKFIASDASGAVVSAKIWLLVPPASVLAEVEVNESGVEEVKIARDVTYYAYATSPRKLPVWSKEFVAGQVVKLIFENSSPENTANLTLAVRDEDAKTVYAAVASLYTIEGLFAGPSRITDAEGLVSFEGLPIGDYEARVSYAQKTAGERIALAESKLVNLTIELAVASLEASAVDAATGQPVAANFTSYRYDAPFAACAAEAGSSCRLKIKTGVPVQVIASSLGYLDFAVSKTLEVDSKDNFTAVLIPSSAAVQPTIEFLNLTTLAGKPVAFVKPGGTYAAYFLLASPQESEAYGLHVRVGDKYNASQEIAGILDAPTEGALSVATSHSFKPSQQCGDLGYDQQVNGVWKWVDIAYEGAGSRILKLKIKVSESARSSDKLQLRFRAYSRKGPVWSRAPADEDLGFNESSAAKAGCYATAFAQDYEIVVPAPVSLAPEEVAKEFTPSLAITWDPHTQQLIPPVKEIALQIDSIMPADAVPLSLVCPEVAEGEPRVLVSAVESNATPPTTACYGYDEAAGMLWFKSGDAGNPACPIRVRGNEVEGDSAVLPIACSIAPGHVLKLPVRVATKSLESFFIRPESEALGEGNAAKLIYLVNNKQLGPRTFLLESFAGAYAAQAAAEKTEVSLDGPGVKAIAWTGPGILDVSESAASPAAGEPAPALKEYSYDPDTDFKVRGISYGTLGLPTGSCADHRCCSQAWCAKKAAQQALEFLKAEAPKIAEVTAFRRGSGMPWQYFSPSKPFAFYTAMQVKEGGVAALESLGVSASLLAACGREKPGVFEVKVESQNGSSWSYAAKTMELTNHGYVEKKGRDAAPERMALCNFLYGAASNVNSSNTSNEFTWHQKSKFDLKINVCMYPIFQGWSPLCAFGIPVHPRVSVLSYNYEAIENEGSTQEGINNITEKITSSNLAVLGIGDKGWEAMKECMGLSLEWRNTLVSWVTRSLDWLLAGKRKPYSQVVADWVNQIVPIAVGTCVTGGAGAAGGGNVKDCRGLLAGTLVGGVQGLPGGYTVRVCDGVQIRIDVGVTGTDCSLNFAPEVTEAARVAAAQVGTQLITWLAFNQAPTLSCITPLPLELPIAGTEAVKEKTLKQGVEEAGATLERGAACDPALELNKCKSKYCSEKTRKCYVPDVVKTAGEACYDDAECDVGAKKCVDGKCAAS